MLPFQLGNMLPHLATLLLDLLAFRPQVLQVACLLLDLLAIRPQVLQAAQHQRLHPIANGMLMTLLLQSSLVQTRTSMTLMTFIRL